MTLPRWQALMRFWRRHPRTEWLAAAYLKFKPPIEDMPEASKEDRDAEMRQFLTHFGATRKGTVIR